MDPRQTPPSPDSWWKNGIVYQIYPRSFQDSDGDGIGDLRGIRQRLDYLVALGVDAVWISPIYPSPMADFGYDISDYCGIDARFGTLADFDELVRGAHARGLKVILDFVPNHTSDQHPWFTQSRSSRQDPKRDWYIWRDPAPDGGPPNNWLSNFGGPAWTLDAATGQYYLHSFLREQPDLDWRNPDVRAAMYEALRFWLRRGVDGFRIDVLYHLVKDALFRDNPANPAFVPGGDPSHSLLPLYTADLPEVQDIVREMRAVVDAFSDAQGERVLIGELYLPLARLMAYYGLDGNGVLQGVQLPFNFQLIGAQWQADVIRRLVRDYEAALPPGAAPNWVLGNHDKPRIASRVGPLRARLAAMLLLTLRGTPTLYYGDEIGMTDVPIPPDEVQDPFEKNEPGKGLGRDPQRTPMQWSAAEHAGFSQGRPWLRLADDWATHNVELQQADGASMLALYRRLIALRRAEPALHAGAWEPVDAGADVVAYARTFAQRRLVVLLNFAEAPRDIDGSVFGAKADVLASTRPERAGLQGGVLTLQALEGVVLACANE
ncbi:alpha-amylase family glycosyl hydrolase [Variovorax sp. J22G73]|uniref:alpha-amylase family glycosyl hydrolase n=1 Tax=unclassified Variovorax TaxID=663243 RepID=UPI002576AEF5|nr:MULTISPECIES: alpha-amylase family glycosyl hydrolase [unclassified Variovorax]MDM0005246.1 alpha-amylase family glycosyl hydrolase [Variovorax sp. J22R203]MDM0098662.1 alpha-amylase family glycosyl hydrolase [Variovorax sp. J22G73]